MIYEITWRSPSNDTIDLKDYGHDEKTLWEDLSEDEQNEILDPIRDEAIPMLDRIDLIGE